MPRDQGARFAAQVFVLRGERAPNPEADAKPCHDIESADVDDGFRGMGFITQFALGRFFLSMLRLEKKKKSRLHANATVRENMNMSK